MTQLPKCSSPTGRNVFFEISVLSRNNRKSQTHLQCKKSFAMGKLCLRFCLYLVGRMRYLVQHCSVAVQVGVAFWKSFWQPLLWKQASVLWHFCKVSADEARARLLEKEVGLLSKVCGTWLVCLRREKASKLSSVLTSPEFAQPILWLWPKPREAKGKVTVFSWWSQANTTFVHSYIPRKILLASKWPLFLLREVTVAGW